MGLAAWAFSALIVAACSHDWAPFEPRATTSSGGGLASGGSGSIGGGSGAMGGGGASSSSAGGAGPTGGASSAGGSGGATTTATVSSGNGGNGPLCGNGMLDPGEECDDGNSMAGDGCTDCLVDCGESGAFKDPTTHHCYWFVGSKLSWDAAGAACRVDARSDLAAPSTLVELAFVGANVSKKAWIGGHWDGGAWVWSFGEPWSYGDDQPAAAPPWEKTHNDGHTSRTCVAMISATTIDAEACDGAHDYVCERTP